MTKRKLLMVAASFAVGWLTVPCVQADSSVLMPKQIKWAPSPTLPKGGMSSVLQGNPTQPGPYVVRVKFPPKYKIQPHTHADDRTYTVISGTMYFGDGEKFDKAKLKELPAGSFLTLPAGQKHFQATEGEVVVQIAGNGPTNIEYINPSDDPRNK